MPNRRPGFRLSAATGTHANPQPGSRIAIALPANAVNWMAVWRRNYLVWKKLAFASMIAVTSCVDSMVT